MKKFFGWSLIVALIFIVLLNPLPPWLDAVAVEGSRESAERTAGSIFIAAAEAEAVIVLTVFKSMRLESLWLLHFG